MVERDSLQQPMPMFKSSFESHSSCEEVRRRVKSPVSWMRVVLRVRAHRRMCQPRKLTELDVYVVVELVIRQDDSNPGC